MLKSASPTLVQLVREDMDKQYLSSGTVNGIFVSDIYRDTGCSTLVVSDKLVPKALLNDNRTEVLYDYLGRPSRWPVAEVYFHCNYFEGWRKAVVAPIKWCSVLVGNLKELETNSDINLKVSQVRTRRQARRAIHPLSIPAFKGNNISSDQFKALQSNCPTLSTIIDKQLGVVSCRGKDSFTFVLQSGILYRKCVKSSFPSRIGKTALVVPKECRRAVLDSAHESPLAGHFSHRKTEMKVKEDFFWPGMTMDIREFCRSCDACQRFSQKGRLAKVPLMKVPIITEPFSRVCIDLVGPIQPPSSEGHRYILTLIDVATSFPEAMPLHHIDSISVSEALLQIFSRVGIPKEIHSDLGTQFTSNLMQELNRLLGIQPVFNTPYHPMGTGRIERLHSTLKSVLKKLCSSQPQEWHRFLIPTLFALREVPSDRTGFSPFELLYGRQMRGPVTVLRELWENVELKEDSRTSYQYLLDLKSRLEDGISIASYNAEVSQNTYKHYFDLTSKDRKLQVGDEVLVLLPDTSNKLLMSWRGPYKVLECRNRVNYLIDEAGRARLYHINLLKQYYRREPSDPVAPNPVDVPLNVNFVNNVVESELESDFDLLNDYVVSNDSLSSAEDLVKTVNYNSLIPEQLKREVCKLIQEFSDTFSNVPGCTDSLEHEIRLTSNIPVRSKTYPIPVKLGEYFKKEVDSLIELGIIKPSKSPYCSPCLLVKKGPDSYRLVIDFRGLNAITIFDAEPSCSLDEELHRFADAIYFSELDLSKAYHQIPLHKNSAELTAFPTHKGLMEFVRMPFGLVTACATYIRLMRLVLDGIDGVSFYFDNILIFSKTIDDHLKTLRLVLERLKLHNLTVKPSKCSFGNEVIQYLGFTLGRGELRPLASRIEDICNISVPTTKTQLRSFLGMCGFYSKFISNYSELSAPMTDLLKGKGAESLCWTEDAGLSFDKLKRALMKEPILKLPNMNLPFVLRTDGSNTGIGAVLLQFYGDMAFPVAYASKKLNSAQRNYSTIERELLAIVFGVGKFKYYLLNNKFILEVDHKPLLYLGKFKGDNPRLMRWALALQAFCYRIVHIPGSENVGADFLSRTD